MEIKCYLQVFTLLVSFVETVQAYDQVWILGDSFIKNTHEQFFLNSLYECNKKDYIMVHYDTEICFRNLFDEGTREETNVIMCLHNALVETINSIVLLPKAIIVLVDDDILDDLDHYDTGISSALGKILEWITGEFHKIISSHKEKLPSKSR